MRVVNISNDNYYFVSLINIRNMLQQAKYLYEFNILFDIYVRYRLGFASAKCYRIYAFTSTNFFIYLTKSFLKYKITEINLLFGDNSLTLVLLLAYQRCALYSI